MSISKGAFRREHFEGSISKGAFRRVHFEGSILKGASERIISAILFNSTRRTLFLTYLAGKDGHVTVLGFLVCAQGCKISDITFFSPVQRQLTCQVRKTLGTKRFPGDFDVL